MMLCGDFRSQGGNEAEKQRPQVDGVYEVLQRNYATVLVRFLSEHLNRPRIFAILSDVGH